MQASSKSHFEDDDTYVFESVNLICNLQPEVVSEIVPPPRPAPLPISTFSERYASLSSRELAAPTDLKPIETALQNHEKSNFPLKNPISPFPTDSANNAKIDPIKNLVQKHLTNIPSSQKRKISEETTPRKKPKLNPPVEKKTYSLRKKPPKVVEAPKIVEIPKKVYSLRKKEKKTVESEPIDLTMDTDEPPEPDPSRRKADSPKSPKSKKRHREPESNSPDQPKKKRKKKNKAKKTKKAELQGTLTSKLFRQFEKFLDDFISEYADGVLDNIPLGRSISGTSKMSTIFTKTKLDWRSLSHQILALSQRKLLTDVNVEDLVNLQNLIQKQMEAGGKLNVFTPYDIPTDEMFECMNKSIEGAKICLHIMTMPNVHRSLIREGCLRTLLKLLKHYVVTALIPWKNPALWAPTDKVGGKKKKKGKKAKNAAEQTRDTYLKEISGEFNSLHENICHMLDLLQTFLRNEPCLEEQLTPIVDMCFVIFKAQNINVLELAAIGIINSIFVHTSSLRLEILKKITDVIAKAPRTRSRKQGFAIEIGGKKSGIAMMHGLLLLCLQSLPTQCIEDINVHRLSCLSEEITTGTHSELFEQYISENATETTRLIQSFATKFVLKFAHQKIQGKNLVSELVSDLLSVWFLPEWPIAELLLYAIGHVFFQIMAMDKKQKKKHQQSARLLAVEVLGDICRECLVNLRKSKEAPLTIKNKEILESDDEPDSEELQNTVCICGHALGEDESVLDCDDCHSFFHMECVGIDEDNIPEEWVCHSCQIRDAVTEQFKSSGVEFVFDKENEGDATDVVRLQLLLNYLSGKAFQESTALSSAKLARQFHLMNWLYNQENDKDKKEEDGESDKEEEPELKRISDRSLTIFRNQWVLPKERYENLPSFSRKGITSINRQLAAKRLLLKTSQLYLNYICKVLHDSQPSFRTKAMKALANIVAGDASVLTNEKVLEAVKARFRDKSALVREAAIDLIGKYAMNSDSLLAQYYPYFRDRINDAGLSVRKRVIKIFREICLKNPDHPKYIDMCVQLLRHVNEVNAQVRKLVTETFETIWFSDTAVLRGRKKNKRFTESFAQLVQQIVDVIGELMNAGAEHAITALVDLITQMLSKDEGLKKLSKKAEGKKSKFFAVCKDICAVLKEKVTAYEGTLDDIKNLLPLIKTLHIFCTVRPVFLLGHHEMLQPYLKAPSIEKLSKLPKNDLARVHIYLQTLAEMMNMVLPMVEHTSPAFQKHLMSDLCSLILRYPILTVVRPCISCLCVLCVRVTKDTKALRKFMNVFVNMLDGIKKGEKKVQPQWAHKSLFCVGAFLKYFDFDKYFPRCGFSSDKGSSKMTDVAYGIFLHFCRSQEDSNRYHAVQALIFLFSRRPQLLLQKSSRQVLKAALAMNSSDKMKYRALMPLRDFLVDERQRMEFLREQRKKKDKGPKSENEQTGHHFDVQGIREDDDTDPGIIAGVMQEMIPSIVALCKHKSDVIRENSLRLLREILKQGMINPVEVMPTLIALTTDPHEASREQAMAELKLIGEKYPVFFKSRLLEGIVSSFHFHRDLFAETFDVFKPEFITPLVEPFNGLYRILSQSKNYKVARFDFIKSVLQRTVFDKNKGDVPLEDFPDFVAFMMSILAHLGFELDEPLFIIRWVDSLLSSEASELESRLNEIYEKMTIDPNTDEDINNITPQLLSQYEDECSKALATASVIKLREYVKWVYGLHYDQIQRFEESSSCKVKCSRKAKGDMFNLQGLPHIVEEIDFEQTFEEIPSFLREQHSFLSKAIQDAVTDVETVKSGEIDFAFSDDEQAKSRRPVKKRGPPPDSVLSKKKKPKVVKKAPKKVKPVKKKTKKDSSSEEDEDMACMICSRTDDEEAFLLCDCDEEIAPLHGGHYYCFGLKKIPTGDWYCAKHQKMHKGKSGTKKKKASSSDEESSEEESSEEESSEEESEESSEEESEEESS